MNPIDITFEDYIRDIKNGSRGSTYYQKILRTGGGSTTPVTVNVQRLMSETWGLARPAYRALLLHGISDEMFEAYKGFIRANGRDERTAKRKVRAFKKLVKYVEDDGIEAIVNGIPYPIEIWVNQEGKVRLVEGGHRLALMSYFGVREAQAIVMARHPKFLAFYDGLVGRYEKNPTFSYHPIDHVDFQGWEFGRDRQYLHRIATLLRPGSTVLDVGSNMGYMSTLAWKRGCVVDSVEASARWVKDQKFLRRMYDADYNLIHGDATTTKKLKSHYDTVLVLSVIHHLMKKGPKPVVEFMEAFAPMTNNMMIDFGGGNHFTPSELLTVITEQTPFRFAFKTDLECSRNKRHLYILCTKDARKNPICYFDPRI